MTCRACTIGLFAAGAIGFAFASRAGEGNAAGGLAAARGQAAGAFFEDFESYDTGAGAAPLDAQSGWTSENPPAMLVVSTNPISGQSGRHVMDRSLVRDFEMRSPPFGPDFGRFEADIRIDPPAPKYGWVEYQLTLIDTETQYFNTRIKAIAYPGVNPLSIGRATANRTVMTFEPLANFTPGEPFRLAIEVSPGGALRVFKDGAPIYAGIETSRAIFGRTGRIGRFDVLALNGAEGAADGSIAALTIDNVSFTPNRCPSDINGDGLVGSSDLVVLIADWGAGGRGIVKHGDLNGDGPVNSTDLGVMLGAWGACP